MSITKKDLIKAVSKDLGKTQVETQAFFDSFIGTIKENLSNGDDVNCIGVFKFYMQNKKATVKRNPKTGAKVNVPAKKVAKCKLGSFFQK